MKQNKRMLLALSMSATIGLSGAIASAGGPIPGLGDFLGDIREAYDEIYETLMYMDEETLDHYMNTPLCELLNGDRTDLSFDNGLDGGVPCFTGGQVLRGYGAANAAPVATQMTRISVRNPGRKRMRFRMGLWGTPVVDVPAPVLGPKGGMIAPGAPPAEPSAWEIFGDVYYLESELDQRLQNFGGLVLPLPKAENEMWGGNLGARYRFNQNWSIGGQIGYAEATLDQTLGAFGFSALLFETDIEMWAISPFVSYTMPEIFPNADLMIDFLYSYGDQEYDTGVLPGLFPGLIQMSSEGNSNTFDLNGSLVMKNGAVRHGPYLGLRYIDGDVDDATLRVGGAAVPLIGSGYDFESFTSTLGYQVSYVVDGEAGALVPQFKLGWEHEFEDDFAPVAGLPVGVDENVIIVGAGLGWYADAGWNLVFDYEGRWSDNYESHLFGLKAGIEF